MDEMEELIKSVKALINSVHEEELTDEVMQAILKSVDDRFNPQLVNQAINQIINNLEAQNLTKNEAKDAIKALTDVIREMAYEGENLEGSKKTLIDQILNKIFSIFDDALQKYHSYSIELPMTVDTKQGAKVPVFAHDTDAAADLYAIEDQVIQSRTFGNMIKTGIKIQLPEGWLALILPRSSTGLKTPLRLSNSVGLIDSGYRGEIGVIFDNLSDGNYTIHAGDRIAQLLVMPSYRFQAKVVDILASSDRGESGFGSSGN